MKKMNYLWMMMALVGLSLSTVSCYVDEDEHIGNYVSGHWFGDMDMYVNGQKALGSEIEFTPTGWGSRSGYGVEVDYYYGGTITHRFNWRVRDEVIYLTFDDPMLDCAIVDYRLSTYYFSGYVADYYTLQNQTYFNLRSYDRYWDQYGYYDPYPYYAKGEKDFSDTTAIGNNETADSPTCMRGVNLSKVKSEE